MEPNRDATHHSPPHHSPPHHLTCPMCRKAVEPAATPCPRCRADLTLLVDYMANLDEHLAKADAALKAGEIGDAVFAYLNVLEVEPAHPTARKQVGQVVSAVRRFDGAKRGRVWAFALGIGITLLVV